MARNPAVAASRLRHPDDTRMPEDVLVPPSDPRRLARWVKTQNWVVRRLIEEYRTSRGNSISGRSRQDLAFARKQFFPYLRFDIRMTPDIKRYSKLDESLRNIAREDYGFPRDLVASAELLYQKFESERWGSGTATTPRASLTGREPPVDHPIWGLHGIMHGAVMFNTGKKVEYGFDNRYMHEKRDAKVYGHNGLSPGDWFPLNIIARFQGAHAGMQAGISGDRDRGAYSIVVSGQYEEDKDEGEVLYYSGESAEKNENPHEIIRRAANDSLLESLRNGRPVRVLRSATKGERQRHYAPSCGIRYDGLYNVVGVEIRRNAKGGLFQRFRLHRCDGQESLADILARSPSADQVEDYRRLRDGY